MRALSMAADLGDSLIRERDADTAISGGYDQGNIISREPCFL